MNWYATVLRKYAVFHGRARRKEYWMFVLISFLVSMVLAVLDFMTGMFNSEYGMGPLSGLYSLAVVVPSIAVSVRRLHDIGRSGWWLLIGLVPILGALVLLYFAVLQGTRGDNRFGADPKAVPEPLKA